jgi:hypothetical protein
MKENYSPDFLNQVASELGEQTLIIGSRIVKKFEYGGYCFSLQYSYGVTRQGFM